MNVLGNVYFKFPEFFFYNFYSEGGVESFQTSLYSKEIHAQKYDWRSCSLIAHFHPSTVVSSCFPFVSRIVLTILALPSVKTGLNGQNATIVTNPVFSLFISFLISIT